MPNRDDVIRMAREAGYGTQINSGDGGFTFSTELWGGPLETEKLTRFAQLVAELESDEIIGLLMNDAFAASFQSMGQYRAALLGAIRARGTA